MLLCSWLYFLPAESGSWLAEALSDSESAGFDSAAVESGSGTTGTGPIEAKRFLMYFLPK